MIEYASLTDELSPAVEADVTDWAEQHRIVTLPDEEYPHLNER